MVNFAGCLNDGLEKGLVEVADEGVIADRQVFVLPLFWNLTARLLAHMDTVFMILCVFDLTVFDKFDFFGFEHAFKFCEVSSPEGLSMKTVASS